MQASIYRLCRFHRRTQLYTRRYLTLSQQQNISQRCFQHPWHSKSPASSINRIPGSPLLAERSQGYIHRLVRSLSMSSSLQKPETITINYINRDGSKMSVKGEVGDSLLDVAIDNDLEIEGYGACEGTLACSTCHLIFEGDQFSSLPEATDEEQDMLDFACGLTDTSRLGCQITLTKDMDGMTVRVPEGVADARDV